MVVARVSDPDAGNLPSLPYRTKMSCFHVTVHQNNKESGLKKEQLFHGFP